MTIQEKIREGIEKIIKEWVISNYPIGPEAFSDLVERIQEFEDSQGVVLRKDGHVEFNLTGIPPTPTQMSEISKAYKEAGYEATEPLI